MIIHRELDWEGKKIQLEYHDVDSFDDLPRKQCTQSYGVCFLGDKFVIGLRGRKGEWGIIGGSIEEGETLEEALAREVREESNMRVLRAAPIGYQKVTAPSGKIGYQLRFCALVEPIGPFVSDPAGSITEMKLVSPDEYKEYFDWGEIGERIIRRAVEIKEELYRREDERT